MKTNKLLNINLQLFGSKKLMFLYKPDGGDGSGTGPNPNPNPNPKPKNYLEFATEEDFKKHTQGILTDYQTKIDELENENKSLKAKDLEIQKLNNRLDIFENHIKSKYEVKDVELDKDKLDYSNYDNLEKSMLKQFEAKKINYKKDDHKPKSEPTKKVQVYL